MRTEFEVGRAVEKHADTVRRICYLHLKNYSDVEDIFQDVFLKYLLSDQAFDSDEHEKAWLIRIAINACKDTLKNFFRRNVMSTNEIKNEPFYTDAENNEVLEAVLKLPGKYKNVVYMHYYEGYSAVEISRIINIKENTIYTWLSRAREMLKNELGGESFGK